MQGLTYQQTTRPNMHKEDLMERPIRTFAKAITWQIAGMIVMVAIGYAFTGSFAAGGGIALVSSATGFLSYFLHERIWSAVKWGWHRDHPVMDQP